MEYIFDLSKYDEDKFIFQVTNTLEKMTELNSREKYKNIWKTTDKLSAKEKVSEQVMIKRKKRSKLYAVVLILLGLFLLIPSLIDPKEMKISLIISIFTLCVGILNLLSISKYKKKSSFAKASEKLFSEYKNIPKIQIIFREDKIQILDNFAIEYNEIEKFFLSEDFYIVIWNERITVLKKNDLIKEDESEFMEFIRRKLKNGLIINIDIG